jgi:hypothetical protein
MTTDFRALCAELLAAADEYAGMNPYMRLDNAMKTARAALAAEQEGPSDAELIQLACNEEIGRIDFNGNIITRFYYPKDIGKNVITFARAVLARWGRSTTQPEPMTPTDEELTLVYAYAVTAVVDNKRGPFKPEEAEAAQLAGLRAVLARWGNRS